MSRRWTPERDEQLHKLASESLTAEKIAAALGRDFTRNMVIGRANRIGASLGAVRARPGKRRPPPQPSKPTRRAPEKPAQRQKPSLAPVSLSPAPAAPEPPVAAVEPLPSEPQADNRVTIADLRMPISQCRWIDGEPTHDAVYCGAPVKPGSSWCSEHREHCYVPYRRSAA